MTDTLDAFFTEAGRASGADPRLDEAIKSVKDAVAAPREGEARRTAERLAVILQASLLVRHAPPAVADAFCASRLDGDHGRAYGTLPAGPDFATIIDRTTP